MVDAASGRRRDRSGATACAEPYQKPERKYFELSEGERQEWVLKEVPKIRAAVQKYRAVLCFQDEADVSLAALLAKSWAPRGRTPKQTVTGKRGGAAAMSATTSGGNLVFLLHEKRIASPAVIDFLARMLKHHRHPHLVVVMDQALPHVSKATLEFIESQGRLHVIQLPKYSPDWNPDEKVWNHLKHEELEGHRAKTKDELSQLTHRELSSMSRDPGLLRGISFAATLPNS